MKNLILTATMNTILATSLNAQGPLPMTPTTNWLSASHETLGANAPTGWLMDMDVDELEIYVTLDRALVLVDRAPIASLEGSAYLRNGIHGVGGTSLSLVGEVTSVSDDVLHGVYSGLLGGTAVLMDQYVRMRNGVPLIVVRVIARVQGSAPAGHSSHEHLALSLLDGPPPSDAALTEN